MITKEARILLENCGFKSISKDETKWEAPRFRVEFFRDFTYFTIWKKLHNQKSIVTVSMYNQLGEDMAFDIKLFTRIGVFRAQKRQGKPE